ncbi:MAG TPA: hypothetical protein VFM25_10550 [Verrucomicrobiae bacterium]|nr:hypothetical protein [Verrucomicrobiae bacterium]
MIADSAYPEQISAGVETIYTGADQLDVLRTVLAALNQYQHVRPIVHLDAELSSVTDSQAPGVTAYRTELNRLLGNVPINRLPHEELISKLDEAGRTFRVVILKSNLKIPYTTIFLQLDCGYWSAQQEQSLRAAMSRSEATPK